MYNVPTQANSISFYQLLPLWTQIDSLLRPKWFQSVRTKSVERVGDSKDYFPLFQNTLQGIYSRVADCMEALLPLGISRK